MQTATNESQNMTLSEICADLFLLIVYLRESQVFDPPDALYDRIVSLFNAMERKARKANIVDADIQDAKYALVALIDQTIGWASRLELKFFGTSVAGAEFFNKLEREKETEARDDVALFPSEGGRDGVSEGNAFPSGKGVTRLSHPKDEVLEVYYLCLMLGFEGMHVRNPAKLQAYIKEFQKKLALEGLENLSPYGERPKESIKRSRTSISWWMPLAFAGSCLVGSILVFILLEQRITNWAATIAVQIQRLLG